MCFLLNFIYNWRRVFTTAQQPSWGLSVHNTSSVSSCVLHIGALSGILGRRKAVLLFAPLVSVGWILIGAAQNRMMLFLGRFLISTAVQLHHNSVTVYISESSHPDMRSNLVILPALFLGIGTLLVWIITPLVSWRITAYLMAVPCIILAVMMYTLPESPYWLIEKEKNGMAEKALQYYRGKTCQYCQHCQYCQYC